MNIKGWSAAELGRKANVSGRMIGHILKATSNASTDTIDKVASAFGLEGWQLLLPNVHTLSLNHRSSEILSNYLRASQEGKEHILRTAEREAEYNVKEVDR